MVVTRNPYGTVVAPLVRVANLVGNGIQLFERALLGRRTHPVQLFNVFAHGGFNAARHLQRGSLQFRPEGAAHEFLAQRVAQLPVHRGHATLPARLRLGHAAQFAAVESKALRFHGSVQVGSRSMRHVPTQIGAQVRYGRLFPQPRRGLQELWLRHVHGLNVGNAQRCEIRSPVEVRRQALQRLAVQLVEELVGVAAVYPLQAGAGQCGFQAQHRGGLLFCQRRRRTQQHEGAHHVRRVLGAELARAVIVVRVVVAVRQAQPARVREADDLR